MRTVVTAQAKENIGARTSVSEYCRELVRKPTILASDQPEHRPAVTRDLYTALVLILSFTGPRSETPTPVRWYALRFIDQFGDLLIGEHVRHLK
jgi:hypothetical protein